MITEKALQEAISECQGVRNPGANTCLKLAAYYTIKNQLYPERPIEGGYMDSGKTRDSIDYEGRSEFAELINGRPASEIWPIIDDLMDALSAINPRLYNSVMNKIKY